MSNPPDTHSLLTSRILPTERERIEKDRESERESERGREGERERERERERGGEGERVRERRGGARIFCAACQRVNPPRSESEKEVWVRDQFTSTAATTLCRGSATSSSTTEYRRWTETC